MAGTDNQIEQLIAACQAGHRGSLGPLVKAMQAPMLRLANRVLRDPVAAEDAFVEAMSRVLPRIGDFPEPRVYLAYVRSAVRNAAVDLRRAPHRRDSRRALLDTRRLQGRPDLPIAPLTERLPHPAPTPEAEAIRAQRARSVHKAVQALKEPGRTIVRLFYEQSLTYLEISEQLSMSPTTVKRQLGAARHTLAARLGRGASHGL